MSNLLYCQSGGVTSVINATASAVIAAARDHDRIDQVYAGRNGILGVLRENLLRTDHLGSDDLDFLARTPGGAFGSCRYKLPADPDDPAYKRLIEVFRQHDIRYFLYNGGGDSADTSLKISQVGERLGYPVTCIGVPKTIDNDLPITDTCPGFGSVARYVATSILEASYDVRSMAETSTKVFVMEVMGRHAGWIAAAAALARTSELPVPHVILLPEVDFDQEAFLARVADSVDRDGFCSVVVSEGARRADGSFLAESGRTDAFGHKQLGGVAPFIAGMVERELGLKQHWAVLDYLQRSARHLASGTDFEQAQAVGRAAVEFAAAGQNGTMPVIRRLQDEPYAWDIDTAPLSEIANVERKLPPEFITDDGFGITEAGLRYLRPLIAGEAAPLWEDGLPVYRTFEQVLVEKSLPAWEA